MGKSASRGISIVGLIVLVVVGSGGNAADRPPVTDKPPAEDPNAKKFQKMMGKGRDLELSGSLEQALAAFTEAARLKPEDEQVLTAIDRVNLKVRKKRDDDAWSSAKSTGTRAALEGYLDNFPEGDHVADAKAELVNLNAVVQEGFVALAYKDLAG